MKKSDKRTEKLIIETLTEACHILSDSVQGFEWLTHIVDYKSFPESLKIVCIFDTQNSLSKAIQEHQDSFLRSLIVDKLRDIKVPIKNSRQQITFDTEEACEQQHGGNWSRRFESI
ncbi:Fis family transcriptional regulator [Kangiella shandongensis]|uniref:Fis family transcriptional regulator n=1 Tax=Kangiella shandongensis TaxID=2763258 RepID=UPI001CC0DC6D|nr:Fis family transcriptional regulator [Kangiella shandongensis]